MSDRAGMSYFERRSLLSASLALTALAGCGGSQVSSVPVVSGPAHPVRAIAIMPGGGLLADAVAVEISNRGYTVIDGSDTSRLMARLNLNEVEIARPEGLARLREQGIDAVLTVRAAGGYDQQPQSASARVNSTQSGRVISGVTWQNGWGGRAGSIADRTMRKGLGEAAREIAAALALNLFHG
ncbi:hypothetical protein [Falsiroseomonas sp. HW251]|uniref:hypothetical protein n=1 Tax=Falsiroseomonas sp. HW251 TaxID=3390998 RepID=UPI003D311E7A